MIQDHPVPQELWDQGVLQVCLERMEKVAKMERQVLLDLLVTLERGVYQACLAYRVLRATEDSQVWMVPRDLLEVQEKRENLEDQDHWGLQDL